MFFTEKNIIALDSKTKPEIVQKYIPQEPTCCTRELMGQFSREHVKGRGYHYVSHLYCIR